MTSEPAKHLDWTAFCSSSTIITTTPQNRVLLVFVVNPPTTTMTMYNTHRQLSFHWSDLKKVNFWNYSLQFLDSVHSCLFLVRFWTTDLAAGSTHFLGGLHVSPAMRDSFSQGCSLRSIRSTSAASALLLVCTTSFQRMKPRRTHSVFNKTDRRPYR
jgi:hypothetical protein